MVEATDDGKVISPLYTRLIAALVTLSIFLLGVLVICVNHWLKQKKSGMYVLNILKKKLSREKSLVTS